MPVSRTKTAVILLGSDITATERLKAQCKGSYVIAADAGIRHAGPLGLAVDLWIGDFDSATAELEATYQSVPRQTYPAAKDKTDGELAINVALTRQIRDFVLVGALGGPRSDHALLNAFHAMELARAGHNILMSNGHEEAVPLLAGTHDFPLEPGARFSLIGFCSLEGVSIHGARWPLEDRAVPVGSSLTMSNIATGDVKITLRNGRALFITGSGE